MQEGRVPKNWCFRTVVLEKTLKTARRSNQSILKEISPEYSLEGLMLKLKLQYLGHLMRTADSLEKILMLVKIEGRRRRERWHHWFNGHELGQTLGGGEGQRDLACCSLWGCKSRTQLGNWTTTKHWFWWAYFSLLPSLPSFLVDLQYCVSPAVEQVESVIHTHVSTLF